MLNKNVGHSGTPEGRAALRKLIESPRVKGDKERSRNVRIFKNHPDAYITRTHQRDYEKNDTLDGQSCTISMLQLDDVWYIQLTTSLAKLLNYQDVAELRQANHGDVYIFKIVAYGKDSSYGRIPPPNSKVHDTSFVKFDQYKKWLMKTKNGPLFLKFFTDMFRFLKEQRTFVPHYHSASHPQYLPGFNESKDTSLDPLAVSAPVIISSESHDSTSFTALYEEELRKIKEQEQQQHNLMNENVSLKNEIKLLCSRISKLVPFRDGLADAFLMSEGNDEERKKKAQHIRALMSVAAKDRAASEE